MKPCITLSRSARLFSLLVVFVCVTGPAHADIIHFGVDIRPDRPDQTNVFAPLDFYDGNPFLGGEDGDTINSADPFLDFRFGTADRAGASVCAFRP